MKISSILFLILVLSINLFAQDYPEVSIRDVNFAPDDSLLFYGSLNSEPVPELAGDTVIITGVVMNSPYFNANPEDGEMLAAGAPALYLQDINDTEWSGVLCRDPYLGSEVFAILDTGMIIQAAFEVEEYFTTTEINLISFDASNVIGQMERPKPVLLTLDSLFETGTTNPNYLAEKWEGVYVEFRDLTTTEPNAVGSGTFRVFDENNTSMVVYNKGNYLRSGFQAPLAGTSVTSIKGYIETRTGGQYGWFMLNPVYPEDIQYGTVSPPNISDVTRDKAVVKYGEEVQVSARIIDSDGTADVNSAKLFYSVNESAFDSLDMTLTDPTDSIWTATIPALNDSSLVRYYISSTDNDNAKSTNPSNPEDGYFYHVLNRDLTIADVQYSPFGSGFSGYNGYEVTVSGRISADTSDIQGDGANIGPQVYVQDGTGPWSGIQIFGIQAEEQLRGTIIAEVTGIVNESFGVTRIGNLDQGAVVTALTVVDGEQVQPTTISTADIETAAGGSLPAESYEGVLIRIENVTVLDDNADGDSGPDQGSGGSRNFGEIYVADESNVQMRLELQDGTHDFHNFWDSSLEEFGVRIETGHTFESITGILFYSFGNYKLVPRKNDDFVGHITSVEKVDLTPSNFNLSQNYPNPFNPSTKIKYSIPASAGDKLGLAEVNLSVYDILGRKVATLVNQKQRPGQYSINFNASNLASGIYFYSIKAGGFFETKKMLMIK